jgi:hypothetical protein
MNAGDSPAWAPVLGNQVGLIAGHLDRGNWKPASDVGLDSPLG